jgi:hypothetical protein
MYYMYAVADLAKYLPGGIWGIVGRFGVYSLRGLSLGEATRAFAFEHVWFIGSAFFTGVLLCLPFFNEHAAAWLGWDAIASSPLILGAEALLVCAGWGAALYVGTTLVKQRRASIRLMLKVMVIQTAAAFALGISQWALFAPQVGYEHLLLTVGAFALGRCLGHVAFFAPAGIGVREAVIIGILSTVMPVDEVIFWAGINRILIVIAEVSVFPFVYLVYRAFNEDAAPLERIEGA